MLDKDGDIRTDKAGEETNSNGNGRKVAAGHPTTEQRWPDKATTAGRKAVEAKQ